MHPNHSRQMLEHRHTFRRLTILISPDLKAAFGLGDRAILWCCLLLSCAEEVHSFNLSIRTAEADFVLTTIFQPSSAPNRQDVHLDCSQLSEGLRDLHVFMCRVNGGVGMFDIHSTPSESIVLLPDWISLKHDLVLAEDELAEVDKFCYLRSSNSPSVYIPDELSSCT